MITIRTVLVTILFFLTAMISGCPQAKMHNADFSHSSPIDISVVGEKLAITCNSVDLLAYQKQPMENPKGGDKFKGSDFIHPLKTPSGFIITDLQPQNHLHHFGLWWPWKYIMVEGRKVAFWAIQANEGIVEAQGVTGYKTGKGRGYFTAESDYIDKTAPDGPKTVLNESVVVEVYGIAQTPASGYFLDITIMHRCATQSPVEIVPHLYSGFTIRGTANWNRDNSILLASQGIGWNESNLNRANWVWVEGDAGNGKKAGFVMMSCPKNYDAPQRLRTWGQEKDKAIFINFNPVQEKAWHFEPGKEYMQRYRLFVYDGVLMAEHVQEVWRDYVAVFK